MMAMTIDFSDFVRLEKSIKQLGKLPQKCVTKAAKKGARIVQKEARNNSPDVNSLGYLKEGIILVGERSKKKKGKKVYQVVFDSGLNDVFQKKIKNPGKYGGKNPTAYYPASLEYGFKTGGEKGYSPGFRFMRNAAEDKESETVKVITDTLINALDKEWAKR